MRNDNDVVDEFADMTPSWTSHEGEMYELSVCLSILVIAMDFRVAISSNLTLQICSASMTCPCESITKLRHCVHRKSKRWVLAEDVELIKEEIDNFRGRVLLLSVLCELATRNLPLCCPSSTTSSPLRVTNIIRILCAGPSVGYIPSNPDDGLVGVEDFAGTIVFLQTENPAAGAVTRPQGNRLPMKIPSALILPDLDQRRIQPKALPSALLIDSNTPYSSHCS